MSYYNNLRKKHFDASLDNLTSLKNFYIFFGFITAMSLIGVESLEGITNVVGICITIMAVLVVFTSISKEKFPSSDGIVLIGISFGTAAIFYIMAIATKLEINYSINDITKLTTAASYMQVTGILLFSLISYKKLNLKWFSIAFCSAAAAIRLLFYYNLPKELVLFQGTNYTVVKEYSDLLLLIFYLITIALLYKNRKKITVYNIKSFKIFVIANLLSVSVGVVFTSNSHIAVLFTYILKLSCYLLLYKILINNKLIRPIQEIYNQVMDTNHIQEVKNLELQKTVETLENQIVIKDRYEKKLKHAEEKYQKIVNNSPEAIYIQDNSKIIYMNKAARSFFAVGLEESLEGMSFFDMIEDNRKSEMIDRLQRTQVEKTDCPPAEFTCHCYDGSTKVLEVTDINIKLDGKNVTLSIGMDITNKIKMEEDRKRLNEAMEYEKIRSNFFSNISHELRTPVNVIYSSLQVIELYNKQGLGSEKSETYHFTMKQNCLRLIRIINNIIDITSMDSGYYKPSYSQVEIVNLIESTTEAVGQYIRENDIHMIFDTDIEEKDMYVDKLLIERMLLNILSNAVKFSGEKGNIEVNLFDRKDGIEIRIKDNGVGIPEQHISDVFDKFKQVDKSLRRGQEGSGLGLAITKSIVEIHKGRISIQSNAGAGCTIIVYIPKLMENTKTIDVQDFEVSDDKTDVGALLEVAATLEKDNSLGNKDCLEKVMLEFSDIYF